MAAHQATTTGRSVKPVAVSLIGQSWHWMRIILLGLVLAGLTGVVMALPLLPDSRVVLEVGDIAPENIRAPRSITYDSEILRGEERERAAARVQPVYTSPDLSLARQQVGRAAQVLDYVGSVLADDLASSTQKRAWILAVPELSDMTHENVEALVSIREENWNRLQDQTEAVIDTAMRRQIREGFVEEAAAALPSLVSYELSPAEARVVVALARRYLVANSFPDPDGTAEAQARARDAVLPVLRSFKADEILVREGQRVSELDVEALDQLGLRFPEVEVLDSVAAGVLALLGTALLFYYLARFEPDVLWDGQQLVLLVLLVGFFVLIAGATVPGGSILRYLVPAPALAMLLTAALGPAAGIGGAVFLGGAAAVVSGGSLEMTSFAALGALAATLTLGRVERIRELFVSGAYAALVHVIIVVVFGFPRDTSQIGTVLVSAAAGIANGGISASLALGTLFLIGPLFDIVTTMRLIEISRPDHPLLQRLLREAPATYHHSLMVANLAEQAAERIGANALLTRVGAYYHDIGKLERPYFFTENQVDGVNPLDEMDPEMSVQVVIDHVDDGVALARQYRLPRRVRDFISSHHGTGWISFFYQRALERVEDPSAIDEQDFRYRGPKPKAKEVALVMLADPCEAAARARRPSSPEEVDQLVAGIIQSRVNEGQLDDCELTVRDLAITRSAFASVLRGMYHPRVDYPQPAQPRAESAGEVQADGTPQDNDSG